MNICAVGGNGIVSENREWKNNTTHVDLMIGGLLRVVGNDGVRRRRARRHELRVAEHEEVAEHVLVAALHLVHVLVVALLAVDLENMTQLGIQFYVTQEYNTILCDSMIDNLKE